MLEKFARQLHSASRYLKGLSEEEREVHFKDAQEMASKAMNIILGGEHTILVSALALWAMCESFADAVEDEVATDNKEHGGQDPPLPKETS